MKWTDYKLQACCPSYFITQAFFAFFCPQSLNLWGLQLFPTTMTETMIKCTSSSLSGRWILREGTRRCSLVWAESARWECKCSKKMPCLHPGPKYSSIHSPYLPSSLRMTKEDRECWWTDGAPSWKPVSSALWPDRMASIHTLMNSVGLQGNSLRAILCICCKQVHNDWDYSMHLHVHP